MKLILFFLEMTTSIGLSLVLFSKISGRQLTWLEVAFSTFLRIGFAVFFTIANHVADISLLNYWSLPIYMVVISWLLLRPLSKTLLIFYGLFPITLWSLWYRLLGFFILPLFKLDYHLTNDGFWEIFTDIVSTLMVFLFLRWLRYDFRALRINLLSDRDKRILGVTNWSMVSYYFLIQLLAYLEYELAVDTYAYRQCMMLGYWIIFMGTVARLDRSLRDTLQERLTFQRELQLANIESYSRQIEELYREVRGFRHDYSNLIATLKFGIDNDNMSIIRSVYQSVFKDSNKRFRKQKYDVGRLIHVTDTALKSLLAAKFSQALESGISVSLEVPEDISPQGMELIDFLTIVSILCDNAIEAAVEASSSKITISYFTLDNKQLFMIENTTKEEKIDLSFLYDFGVSTKGDNRGVGLYNAMEIINRYPNVMIKTISQNHVFGQTLELRL
ncbi:sensor histidine kinase [Streptococcus equi]|uniref:sensor histidine kinase n=1 Tax=Streptococcus equi TaxID=1336 RepID=UPI0039C667FB|nr:GHKL domain-containing protein [Streptococcus equi subsp. zooepidemicus]